MSSRTILPIRRFLLAVALLLAGFYGSLAHAAPLQVVSTFSILADLVQQIGGERVAVTSLIGPAEDAHGYRPRPSDTRRVQQADLVFANGLGFDGWIRRLAGPKTVIVASAGLKPLSSKDDHNHDDHDHDHDHAHSHHHGPEDPHAWLDVALVRQFYVPNIYRSLVKADPDGAQAYQTNAARLDGQLAQLDADLRATLAASPARIAVPHDAFAYFEKAYGIDFVAARGISPEAEPSAGEIAGIIRQLRGSKIDAIFDENISDPRLISRIAAESGVRVGGRLYSDALSAPKGEAPSYIAMMRFNLDTLRKVLNPATASQPK